MNLHLTTPAARRVSQSVCAIVAILFTVILSANFVQSTSTIHWLGSTALAA
jgi:hypothetical protein